MIDLVGKHSLAHAGFKRAIGLLGKEKVRLFVERAEDFAESPYCEVLAITFSRT